MEYLKVCALGVIVGLLFVISGQLQMILENQTAAVVEYQSQDEPVLRVVPQ